MCLILFSLHSHPDFPLIVAANRDEFFHRPTDRADFWPDTANILAGRDLEAGGTWLGVGRDGRFAAVTNVRNGRDKNTYAKSRGDLVVSALTKDVEELHEAAHESPRLFEQYNGFNLIYGDPSALYFQSNRGEAHFRNLTPGIYGLSNASLDTPWPKVASAKREMADIVQTHSKPALLQRALFTMMADESKADTDQLPDTGIGEEWEGVLSSRFIHAENYGTRSTSLVLYHKSGRIDFSERNYYPIREDLNFSFLVENG